MYFITFVVVYLRPVFRVLCYVCGILRIFWMTKCGRQFCVCYAVRDSVCVCVCVQLNWVVPSESEVLVLRHQHRAAAVLCAHGTRKILFVTTYRVQYTLHPVCSLQCMCDRSWFRCQNQRKAKLQFSRDRIGQSGAILNVGGGLPTKIAINIFNDLFTQSD